MKSLSVINPKAAGIDIGSEKLHTSIAGDEPVVFGTFTNEVLSVTSRKREFKRWRWKRPGFTGSTLLYYRTLKHGLAYVEQGPRKYEMQYEETQRRLLAKLAAKQGFKLLSIESEKLKSSTKSTPTPQPTI